MPISAADERPSKTQLKKDMHDLQALGLAVADLPESRLEALARDGALGEGLLDALLTYRRTRSHEGRRRQLQYVGKLMRGADPEPLREAVAQAQLGNARDSLQLHEAERWRDELIASDAALDRWIAAHPGADLQPLRTAVRNARAEQAAPGGDTVGARRGRAFRDLFKLIRDALASDEAHG